MPPVVRAQLDYYAVLEIAPLADVVEVNAAFRRLAWRYHPDHNHAPGATLQFQDINEAHQVLIDPVRRAEYDAKWHPKPDDHRRPAQIPQRSQGRRRWRRHRHVREVALTLFAVLFVSSAWVAIFTAMTVAHSAGARFAYDFSAPVVAESTTSCGYTMEMFPVNYKDQHGRVATGWATDIHNCWGGSTRITNMPQTWQPRAGRFVNGPAEN